MTISGIRLRNFRGFRDTKIGLKPLTVLLGPNSAGKSSFGHALAAMTHSHRVARGSPQASLTPPAGEGDNWPVDVGTTADLQTTGTDGRIAIGLETRAGWVEFGFGLRPLLTDLVMSQVAYPRGTEASTAMSPAKRVINPQGGAHTDIAMSASITESREDRLELRRLNENQWSEDGSPVIVLFDGLILKSVLHQTGTARPVSGAASSDLEAFLSGLTYLRATRRRPTRSYQDGFGRYQAIGYAGEWTPSVIHRRGLEPVQYAEPSPLPRDGRNSETQGWQTKEEPLVQALGAWLEKLGLASAVNISAHVIEPGRLSLKVTLNEQNPHDITEVGFGVSQVLPVLVSGLLQPKESPLIVDLPEAHLHPRPQGALADFFCSLVMSGRSAIVETHSEMFFHRLRLRAAMDPVLMDKIAVYFLDPPKGGECCQPRGIGLGLDDEVYWPSGFLQEAWETEVEIRKVRQTDRSTSHESSP